MLNQELPKKQVLKRFIAVLGLDTEDAGRMIVFSLIPKLAAIVTVCKALVVDLWLVSRGKTRSID